MTVLRSEGDGGAASNPTEAVVTETATNIEKTGWLAGVKDSIFNEHKEDLGKHTNVNTVLEDYYGLKSKMESVVIPEKAEEYELGDVPEGAEKSEEFDNVFKELSKKSDLSTNQAKELYAGLKQLEVEGRKAQAEEAKKALEATTKAMKAEYGLEYDAVMARAAKVLELGGDGFKASLDESGLGNDPRMIRAIAAIGNIISEDSLNKVKGQQKAAEKSLAERLYPQQGKK